ncbi:hypothetical protein AB0F30_16765 [Streptomyces sp. NPDC029006]|uniref:hypothetical protein n=1 Tax=Streptomyces sp. NPDC029006 TaxID=3155467 RepID=UPI0033FA1BC5
MSADTTTVVTWIIQCRGLPDGPFRGDTEWRWNGGPGSPTREQAEEFIELYRRRPGYLEYRPAKRTITTTDDPSA